MSTRDAKNFWKNQETYPFDFIRRRRIFELNYLVPKIHKSGGSSLLDIGCGDGALLECLLRTTDLVDLYGYDIAPRLLEGIDSRIETAVFDLTSPSELPKVDMTVVAGAIQYVFDDEVVEELFSRITSPVLWVRSTCTLQDRREEVSSDDYASCYRTLTETHDLLSKSFLITSVDRVYPDELESAFGTKQFYFEAKRRT